MLCEICGQNEAIIHRVMIINGKRTEQHFCAKCAKEIGLGALKAPVMPDIMTQYLQPESDDAECRCGTTIREFKRTGILGCESCYTDMRDELMPIIKRLQGGRIEHRGHISSCSEANKLYELKKLRNDLAEAVNNEQYELAAELRDKIKALTATQEVETNEQ